MMTTLLRRHPNKFSRRAALLGNHFKYSPNLLLDFARSTMGFRRAFAKTRNWVGEAFSGMITTLFRGRPE